MAQSDKRIFNETIAKKIKSIRQENGVTLEIFYFDTGIHLARIEQGKTNITVFTLQQICDYFEISIAEFFLNLDSFRKINVSTQ